MDRLQLVGGDGIDRRVDQPVPAGGWLPHPLVALTAPAPSSFLAH
jgi:hypothetical protein